MAIGAVPILALKGEISLSCPVAMSCAGSIVRVFTLFSRVLNVFLCARPASRDARVLTGHIITVETPFREVERLWPRARVWVRSEHHF
jgi:hypothetical protein